MRGVHVKRTGTNKEEGGQNLEISSESTFWIFPPKLLFIYKKVRKVRPKTRDSCWDLRPKAGNHLKSKTCDPRPRTLNLRPKTQVWDPQTATHDQKPETPVLLGTWYPVPLSEPNKGYCLSDVKTQDLNSKVWEKFAYIKAPIWKLKDKGIKILLVIKTKQKTLRVVTITMICSSLA